MKTNKLSKSTWLDSYESDAQSQQTNQPSGHYSNREAVGGADCASNDASYCHDSLYDKCPSDVTTDHMTGGTPASSVSAPVADDYFGYKSTAKKPSQTEAQLESPTVRVGSPATVDYEGFENENEKKKTNDNQHFSAAKDHNHSHQSQALNDEETLNVKRLKKQSANTKNSKDNHLDSHFTTNHTTYSEIPERVFMNGLIKHTGIALAIIIPLAAISAYAATPPMETTVDATADKTTTEPLSIDPSAIIHKSADSPTTVDSIDLEQYAGTWYEIGRLPMYFQRKCAGDVTANYTEKTDGSGIIVTNKCAGEDGSEIVAEGLAKAADDTGSKLKVTFLPSWIRWLPVGRADYWVLAHDADYKTALVGTPDKDSLWLLARSPNINQESYTKYRQIAQQQGYDLKEFKLTQQSNQTVSLMP